VHEKNLQILMQKLEFFLIQGEIPKYQNLQRREIAEVVVLNIFELPLSQVGVFVDLLLPQVGI